jgi:hypothetical protein
VQPRPTTLDEPTPDMSRTVSAAKGLIGGLTAWMARFFGWIVLTGFLTLGGALALMLLKDWTIKSLFTSAMVWPMLGLGALLAPPLALLPVGRPFFYSSAAWALLYNLILLLS